MGHQSSDLITKSSGLLLFILCDFFRAYDCADCSLKTVLSLDFWNPMLLIILFSLWALLFHVLFHILFYFFSSVLSVKITNLNLWTIHSSCLMFCMLSLHTLVQASTHP